MNHDEKILANIQRMLHERKINGVELFTLKENTEIHTTDVTFYYINSNLTIKQARYIEEKDKKRKTLCIFNGTSTCQARVLLRSLKIECFCLDFFFYVPIDYQNNLKYKLLNNEEKMEVKLVFSAKHLPRIHDQDVIARYYGARVGDIFKISRSDTVYYRVVISTA